MLLLSVQFSLVAQSCTTLCDPMDCSTPDFPAHHHLLKLMSIELVTPSNQLILCQLLLLLPSVFPRIRVFSKESVLWIRWSKYWSFTLTSVLPINIQDWSPLGWTGWISLQSKGLSSLLQHHSSKASILWYSAFFVVQLSHPYMTTGKTITLTRWTFVSKVMSLLFNMLSRLVITFLPRRKHLLISWLQSPSAVIWGPKKIHGSQPIFGSVIIVKH